MWYAPIGSLEYIKNLHNDILIKRYILSEQRLKQNINLQTKGKKKNRLLLDIKTKKLNLKLVDLKKKTESDLTREAHKNRIKGCAVDIVINRSFNKTDLNVVTYDSTKKN